MTLEDLGWNTRFEAEFAEYHSKGWKPARLIRDNKISYGAQLENGEEIEVAMSGTVYHAAETDAELPSVGDWVALEFGAEGNDYEALIRARLERQTCLSRKAPGKGAEEQVMAANVDVVFTVTTAGKDLNVRRMERYIAVMKRSGATPVVLLNKADLFTDEENQAAKERLLQLSPNLKVISTSSLKKAGVKVLRTYLKRGATIALIGSSGVGKSSLINQLIGQEYLWTGEVSERTGKGIHTTTARELILLPGGGMLIDNPGIREVQVWIDAKTLKESFRDFDEVATQCQFHDCKHGADKGCAIRPAIREGRLCKERFINYLKLDFELEQLSQRKKNRQLTVSRITRREKKSKVEKYDKRKERERY